MAERIRIQEIRFHKFGGAFPEVPTYPHVDTTMLYEGDDKPFHITLPVAEVGRVSNNGLLYDEELVNTIAEQVKQGMGGIRGHLKDSDLGTSFPIDAVNWIGSALVDGTLWCKGFVPISPTREDLRRKKATGGGVGTSIFGDAIKETITESVNGRKAWRAKSFKLETLDLAPAKRAALQMGGEFAVTREMENSDQEEAIMPELDKKQVIAELTVGDLPTALREQIIKEAKVQADAARVTELTSKISELQTQVAEAATFKNIVAEIRSTIGKDTDTVKIVTEYHTAITKLAEMLGVPYSNISVRVEEMHEQVAELAKAKFETDVDAEVVKLTNWQVVGTENQKRLAEFRKTVKKAVVREIGDKHEKITEVAQKVWDEDFKTLAESMVTALAGPGAIIGGKQPIQVGSIESYRTAEGQASLKKAWGYN